MKTRMRVAATALIAAGVLAGCSNTTTGTVAQTTEPGPPLSSPATPDAPTGLPAIPGLPQIPGMPDFKIPGLPGSTPVPEVPAPPNATTMTCSEYQGLDEATRLAVIKAILAEQASGIDEPWVAQIMADAMCQILPDSPVRDAVLGPGG
ncbi:hypothetical protein O6P37_23550 [Mycobacterium sp. CPCC 205372]|uniref:Lipoprotein n=1 Tax=Mycobacterium hippophais TaxID=3016340 RepID=A0ABT4PZ33_9MYCO|nr:hypothetical protein [Mycobacterium hippophais]MCZ8381848.1 hypothetical protein [Mycobacterium hippophais]